MFDLLKNKKILITGGLGFIGSNLAICCVANGAEVTIMDSMAPNTGANLHNIKSIKKNIHFYPYDILDFDRVSELVIDQDIVFNCAASTSHPFSMKEPWLNLDVNSRGVINILEAIKRFNPKSRFIHLGTTTQIGKQIVEFADETHSEFPTDIYSANKCVSEKYVLIYAAAHKLRASVVRLSNTYGPRAAIHSPDFTFNNYFIGLSLLDKEITVYGEGGQKRNFIYIEDAVSAIIAVALEDKSIGETYFGVGDEHFSVSEIAKKIVSVIGHGSVTSIGWPAERENIEIGNAFLSNKKLKDVTGWSPKLSIQEGLEKTRDYYDECLNKYI